MLIPEVLNHPITHKQADLSLLIPEVFKDPKNKPVPKGKIIESIIQLLQDYD